MCVFTNYAVDKDKQFIGLSYFSRYLLVFLNKLQESTPYCLQYQIDLAVNHLLQIRYNWKMYNQLLYTLVFGVIQYLSTQLNQIQVILLLINICWLSLYIPHKKKKNSIPIDVVQSLLILKQWLHS